MVNETTSTDAFGDLLTLACGDRSMAEYSKGCGISPAHLSRIRSGICTPTKKLCRRLADDEVVKSMGITSNDFLKAAGYASPARINNLVQYQEIMSGHESMLAAAVIFKVLMMRKFFFQFVPCQDEEEQNGKFMLKIANQKMELTCNFVFRLHNSNEVSISDAENFYGNLGRLLTYETSYHEQYIMVLDQEVEFLDLKTKIKEDMIKGNISVILVDLNIMAVTDEWHFGTTEDYVSFLCR